MIKRAMWDDHMIACYMSHYTGFDGEIQKLKGMIICSLAQQAKYHFRNERANW